MGGGRGGGLVVSVLAFYSNDLSSIPALATNLYRKTKITEKEAGVGPSLEKNLIGYLVLRERSAFTHNLEFSSFKGARPLCQFGIRRYCTAQKCFGYQK